MKALTLVALAGLTLAPAAARAAIEVHGHRGARAAYPENSLSVFRYAIEAGVDRIELDVRLTKDDRVVVSHDPELSADRCVDGDGRAVQAGVSIRSLTLDELKRYDCGTRGNPEFPRQRIVPGTRIPELSEVFELIRDMEHPNARTVGVHIELKTRPASDFPSPREFAALLVAVIGEYGMLDRTVMQSFDFRYANAANRLAKEAGRAVNIKIISPKASWLSKPLVGLLHLLKFRVVPWTVNDREGWDRMIDLRVDGIITDDPEPLIAYLRERGLRP